VRRVRSVRKLPGYATNEHIRLWTSALWAALAAYLAGAVFASTEYNLFPYFMVGYICALYQIASKPADENSTGGGNTSGGGTKELGYGGNKERELVWSR